jgi:hypothetical protein
MKKCKTLQTNLGIPTDGQFSSIFYFDSFFKRAGHVDAARQMYRFFKRYLHNVLQKNRKLTLGLLNVPVSVSLCK